MRIFEVITLLCLFIITESKLAVKLLNSHYYQVTLKSMSINISNNRHFYIWCSRSFIFITGFITQYTNQISYYHTINHKL